MHGKGHEPHTAVGIKVFDRLHEPDIAFLNEVGVRQPIAQIPARNGNHKAQVAYNERLRGLKVAFVSERHRVVFFLFSG